MCKKIFLRKCHNDVNFFFSVYIFPSARIIMYINIGSEGERERGRGGGRGERGEGRGEREGGEEGKQE